MMSRLHKTHLETCRSEVGMGLIVSLSSFGFVFGWPLSFLVLLFTHRGRGDSHTGGEGLSGERRIA